MEILRNVSWKSVCCGESELVGERLFHQSSRTVYIGRGGHHSEGSTMSQTGKETEDPREANNFH